MKGQSLGTMFMLLLLSSLIIIGLSSVIGDIAGNYGQDSVDLEYLSRANKTIEEVEGLQDTITNTPYSDIPLLGGGLTIISGVDAVLRVIPNFVENYTSFIGGVGSALGVPEWIITIFNGALILIFVFGIISAVLRWNL